MIFQNRQFCMRRCAGRYESSLFANCSFPQVAHQLNPFMLSRLFYRNPLDRSTSYIRGVWLVFAIFKF